MAPVTPNKKDANKKTAAIPPVTGVVVKAPPTDEDFSQALLEEVLKSVDESEKKYEVSKFFCCSAKIVCDSHLLFTSLRR